MSRVEGELLRLRRITVFFAPVFFLVAMVSTYGQYAASLVISPTQVQLGEHVSLSWSCPTQLSGTGGNMPLLFGYAQITVNRISYSSQSIPPYMSSQLQTLTGTLSYHAPSDGTFTAILRCYYLGTTGGFSAYVSCPTCRAGGKFMVTPTVSPATTTTSSYTTTPAAYTSASQLQAQFASATMSSVSSTFAGQTVAQTAFTSRSDILIPLGVALGLLVSISMVVFRFRRDRPAKLKDFTTNSKLCKKCSTRLPYYARFCDACGTEQTQEFILK